MSDMSIDMEMTPEEEAAFNELFEGQQKMLEKSALDVQVGGGHYKGKGIQPVVYIHSNKLSFLEGCIVKRITRWREKDGKKDLLKIKHEVDLIIELEGL